MVPKFFFSDQNDIYLWSRGTTFFIIRRHLTFTPKYYIGIQEWKVSLFKKIIIIQWIFSTHTAAVTTRSLCFINSI